MSKLVPDGWVRTKLANVSLIQPGINVPKSKMGYGVPYVTVKDLYDATSINVHSLTLASIEDRNIKKHSLRYGDIVLAKSSVKREGIGFPIMFSGNEQHVIPSGFTVRVRPIPNIIDDNFLFQSQRSEITRRWVISNAQQSAITNLNADIINDIPVLLPPLPEQQKIASILTSVDEVIEKTQSQINKLQDVKKGTMNELLTRGIGHTEFKDSPVGRIPKGWDTKSIQNISVDGTQNGLYKSKSFYGHGFEMVHMTELFKLETIENVGMQRVDVDREKENQFFLEFGDLLFARRSLVAEGSGKCSIVGDITEPITFESSIIRVRPKSHMVDPKFCYFYISSDIGHIQMMKFVRQVAVSGITGKDLLDYLLPIPPLPEQQKIASILSSIDTNIEEKQRKLQQTKSLKKSLMQDLLTGKVRVSVH